MIRYLCLLAFAACGAVAAAEQEDPSKAFYIQLVRGTDRDDAPQTGAKAIGPKLAKRLQPVFRWKTYWEVNRVKATLEPGHKSKIRLSRRHEVEIDLSVSGKRTVHFFEDGKRVSTSTQPSGVAITIQGGNATGENAWFIVVRKDKPTD
ncbi:MAG: hypothetical protein HYY23_03860 [Verrucomicrobia bacterium]|nr:hypothetical protein [Verrucomicrobiota bacterium]